MALVSVKELLKAGVQYGHRTSRWNPKMAPYIYGKRKGIHIIDLAETVKGLYRACRFLEHVCAEGEEVVFVGTKKPAQEVIFREATRCGMHFVRTRWVGGTLTNFDVIRSRVKVLDEIERIEQSDEINSYSKKAISIMRRRKRKLLRNLEGIRFMERMPGAMVVVDPSNEDIAVSEARKKGIPVIALVDTNGDPDPIDIVIPANDDSMRSISLLISRMADAVLAGRKGQPGPTAVLAAEGGTGETGSGEEAATVTAAGDSDGVEGGEQDGD